MCPYYEALVTQHLAIAGKQGGRGEVPADWDFAALVLGGTEVRENLGEMASGGRVLGRKTGLKFGELVFGGADFF
jgi:hypothetical protein